MAVVAHLYFLIWLGAAILSSAMKTERAIGLW